MTELLKSGHASRDILVQYFLGNLSDVEMAALEDHLVECDTCAARSAATHTAWDIFERFPEAVAQESMEERCRLRLAAAIKVAEGAVKGALEKWMETGAVAAAVGFARARMGSGGLGWAWMTSGPLPPVSSLGPGVPTGGAILTRGSVVEPRPGISTDVGLPDGTLARLSIDGRNFMVQFTRRLKGHVPPLVLVVPDDDSQAQQLVIAEWDDFQKEWRGNAPLPAGEFDVIVGPPPNPD